MRVSRSALAILMTFVSFLAFLFFSNRFDWDHFYSAFEVDRRAWLLDNVPPVWSYQFCAGVSRIGDPQAFGLSPLFVVPLIFGSYWGTKLLIVLCLAIGFYFFRKLLLLLAHIWIGDKDAFSESATLTALIFVLGNYFVWHFHQGHITFALFYFGIAFAYFLVKAVVGNLTKVDFAISNLLLWCLFSAGFYPTTIYFFIPLALALSVYFLIALLKYPIKNLVQVGLKVFLLCLPGLLLASYKLIPALQYQLRFPRQVPADLEFGDFSKTFIYQFFPTYDYKYLGLLTVHDVEELIPHHIWEYSSFSILNWFMLFFLFVLYKKANFRFQPPDYRYRPFLLFMSVYFVVVSLFSFGNLSEYLPHSLLNKLLSNSVRVIPRYQVGFSFIFALVFWFLLVNGKKHHTRLLFVGLALTLLNLVTFRMTLEYYPIGQVRVSTEPMQRIALVQVPDLSHTYMYPAILSGVAVGNCYNPLTRPRNFSAKFKPEQMNERPEFPMVDLPVDSECVRKSYFTQTEIYLDSSCPPDAKLNFNDIRAP